MRQEDEEDGVRWRVEAEVRLAVDRAQQAAAQQEAQMHKDMADMQAALWSPTAQIEGCSGAAVLTGPWPLCTVRELCNACRPDPSAGMHMSQKI